MTLGKQIKLSDLKKVVYKIAYKTYLKEIVKTTPGSGVVASEWDLVWEEDDLVIINKKYGDIVTFLEFGTKPHKIVVKDKKTLRWKVGPGDKFAFAKSVQHPGIEARKFVYNALNSPRLEKEFNELLQDELVKLSL